MKKTIQRFLSLLLLLSMLLALSGCDMDAETAQNITEGILDVLLSDDQTEVVGISVVQTTDNTDTVLPDATAPPQKATAAPTQKPTSAPTKKPTAAPTQKPTAAPAADDRIPVVENGWYDDVESVAAYLVRFGRLPDNYLTKREAQDLGWESSKGNLWQVAPGMSIGGDRFGNYEGTLPKGTYQEADIEYRGGTRNAKRLVFTVKGDLYIYYTDDHYNTFTQVYPED